MNEDAPITVQEQRDELPTTVICTEHTPSNLHGYGILLAFGLVMILSTAIGFLRGAAGQANIYGGIGFATGIVLSLLAGYMLVVWKNRQVEVGPDGIELTDALGKVRPYVWNDVRIDDNRTTSTGGIVFRTRDKREEPFAPSCGGFVAMCELLIRMGKLRRIDEAALARKRKMRGLFDVVQSAGREKVDKSLYLPDDEPRSDD